MRIRPEAVQDHEAIADLTARAFDGVEHSDQSEPALVAALRAAGALTVSLVAEENGTLIGHVAFSPITIDGRNLRWFGLGPVSVSPDRQRQGIGSALVREGLDRLRADGASGCVVLGDPAYYRRFGFEIDHGLRYVDTLKDYFLRIAFGTEVPAGQVAYHAAFGGD
jgi:putative acetyltransferase